MTGLPAAERRPALVVAVLVAVLGTPLGLLAATLTPHVGMFLYQDASQGYPHPILLQAMEENRAAVGGDAVMVAVLAAAGLLVGLLALPARDRAPLGTVVGVLVGGLVAGVVAMAVAHVSVHTSYPAVSAHALGAGTLYQLRPYVRGRVDFVVLPAVALVVFVLGNARWLVRDRRARRLSSGTAAPG